MRRQLPVFPLNTVVFPGVPVTLSVDPGDDARVLRIGGEAAFGTVADVAPGLSADTVYVLDGMSASVSAFAADGRHLFAFGGRGGGPGEFRGLESLHLLPGDTVAAYDYMAGRLSFFAPGGAFVRGVTVEPVDGKLPPRPLGFFGDGRMLVTPLYNPNFVNSPKPTRDTVTLAVYSAAGTQTTSLGRVPGQESVTITGGEGANRVAMRDVPPFALATSFSVTGTRLLVADPARYELVERRPDGSVVRLIRRDIEREPVTQGDRDGYIERRRQDRNDPRFRQMEERLMKSLTFPEHKPFFTAVAMDPAGNAWVRRNDDPDAETPWDVFDAEGRLLGTVTTPAGLRVTQIGADFIVGTWSDELEVPHVRVYRLEKPAA